MEDDPLQKKKKKDGNFRISSQESYLDYLQLCMVCDNGVAFKMSIYNNEKESEKVQMSVN